ncbi:phosphate-starvation-inducible PsiE family protein [Lysobacter sp. FW306-1B-D06B]|uniref:phosphate-starvation-inducible PsiE family protein n=1 Tax=Lysobacter sp. FW306-1B-D06B TaxID=3140250 RepID=UPI0031407C50
MPSPRRSPGPLLQETRERWPLMNHYERFEHVVAFILSVIIALVIALALLQLLTRVVPLLVIGAIDPLDHDVFQGLFGMIMTLLIALEFKHSIIRVAMRRESIVQVKTVVLISLLALSRKFIVLDSKATDAETIAALAVATLVLGIVYWLLRERDDRLMKASCTGSGDGPGE